MWYLLESYIDQLYRYTDVRHNERADSPASRAPIKGILTMGRTGIVRTIKDTDET